MPASRYRSFLLLGAFLVIYIGWGTTYLANHFLLRELPPFVIGTLRFCLAGLLALLWVAARGGLRVQASDWGGALIGGLLLIAVGQGALIYANQHLPTGMLAILYASLPLWSVLLEWLLQDRPPLWVVLGLAIASAGIVLLMGGGLSAAAGPMQWLSGALVLLATLLWAVGAWWLRQRAAFRSAATGLGLQMLIGALVLGGLGLWHDDWQALQLGELSMQGWLWLAYLVLPVSLGVYPAYFWLLREVKPSLVSTFAFVNPVVALLLGYLILDERLSLSAGMACAAVLVGVSMIIFGRRKAPVGRVKPASLDRHAKPSPQPGCNPGTLPGLDPGYRSSDLQQAVTQLLDLVTQLRGGLELQVAGRLVHLFFQLADALGDLAR